MSTDMIQVFCTKSIKFNHPKDPETSHKVRDHEFAYAPSWIRDTDMFKALEKENSIKIIESAKDLARTEMSGKAVAKELSKEAYVTPAPIPEPETDAGEEDEPTEDEAEAVVDLKDLSNKELYAICLERGIEVEKQQNKAYYLDKLDYNK